MAESRYFLPRGETLVVTFTDESNALTGASGTSSLKDVAGTEVATLTVAIVDDDTVTATLAAADSAALTERSVYYFDAKVTLASGAVVIYGNRSAILVEPAFS